MKKYFTTIALAVWSIGQISAQTFPTPGQTLPPGKSIVITYDVDVNSNACPTCTVPSALNISNQSNVSGSNFATVQTDDQDTHVASKTILTPFTSLSLGNLVYLVINRSTTLAEWIS